MGDPRKQRKRYSRPLHPWRKDRIERDNKLVKEYGLKNKKEIWKFETRLNNFKRQAKLLIKGKGRQAELEKERLIKKLNGIGLISLDAKLDDILELNVEDLLKRRLQSLILKKGLAKSAKQSRQLVVHGHIFLNERKVTIPSYIVKAEEENSINYNKNSSFNNPEHPERQQK